MIIFFFLSYIGYIEFYFIILKNPFLELYFVNLRSFLISNINLIHIVLIFLISIANLMKEYELLDIFTDNLYLNL